LVVETDYKKEIFVFDHVAHQHASQLDIYRMIGEEAVQTSLEVRFPIARATTAAYSLTGRLGRARPSRLWAISLRFRGMPTVPVAVFFRG
jgi:hypothetical protein